MPTLPDKFSIPGSSVPNARRGIVGVEPSGMGRAIAGLGAGLYRAGQQAQAQGEADDKLNYARARSIFLTDKIKLESDLQDDPDFEKWGEKYATGLAESRNRAAAAISNPRDRELFTLETNDDFQRGVAGVKLRIREKQKEVGLADLDTTVSKNMDAILQTQDKATQEALIKSVGAAWDGAVQRNWVPAHVAAQKKRQFVEAYAVARLANLPAAERLRLLGAGVGTDGEPTAYGNNIGNLIATNQPWRGKGQPAGPGGKFETFATPEDGVAANFQNFRTIAAKVQGPVTLNAIAAVWAPAPRNDQEKNDPLLKGNDPAVWAKKVGEFSGVDPNAPLDLKNAEQMAAVMRGMNRHEHGKETVPGAAYEAGVRSVLENKPVKVASASGVMSDGESEKTPPAKTGTFVDFIDMPTRLKLQREAANEWEREQAAGRVERETREVQETTGALFSRYGYSAQGVAKALAEIRQNSEGKRQNDLITAYRGRAEESRQLERQADDDLFESAYDLVWQGKANEITPDVRARLEQKGQWDKIGKEIEAQQSGNQQATNWLWYHENYGSKTPAERMKVPLATLKEHMGRSDYEKIVAERKKVTEDDPGERDISTYINQRLKGIGIKGKTEEELKKVDLFHRELEARAAAWQAKNGQKMPNQEKRKLVDELTGKIAIDRPGWFNIDIDAPLFKLTDPNSTEAKRISKDTGIPADQLPLILRKASEYGIKPTMDNLRQIFEEGTQ